MKQEKEARIARSMPARRYKARPMLKGHPAMSPLWRRYLTTRRAVPKRPGIIGRAIGNWKQFLLAEAYNDPMAIVLILAHREMLNLLLGRPPRKATDKSIPRAVSEPLMHLLRKSRDRWDRPQVKRPTIQSVTTPKNDWNDGVGSNFELVRNKENLIVGLFVESPEGNMFTIGSAPNPNQQEKRQKFGERFLR